MTRDRRADNAHRQDESDPLEKKTGANHCTQRNILLLIARGGGIVLLAQTLSLCIHIFDLSHRTGAYGAAPQTLTVWRTLLFIELRAFVLIVPGLLFQSRRLLEIVISMALVSLLSVPLFLYAETFSGAVGLYRLAGVKLYCLSWAVCFLTVGMICLRVFKDSTRAFKWTYRFSAILLSGLFLLWRGTGKEWFWPFAGTDSFLFKTPNTGILLTVPVFVILFLICLSLDGRGRREAPGEGVS